MPFPTATASLAESAPTPVSWQSLSNTLHAAEVTATDDHAAPFQCSASIEPSSLPTDHTLVAEIGATLYSGANGTLLMVWNGGCATPQVAAPAVAVTDKRASAPATIAPRRMVSVSPMCALPARGWLGQSTPARMARAAERSGSGCVVEYQRQGEPLAGADHRHPMPDGCGRPAACGLHWPVPRCEHQAVPVRDEGRGPAGLGSRPLFHHQELTSRVVDAGVAQVDDDLQREHEVAIQVAVQRVPVLLAVLQQDRRRLGLPGRVAHLQPLIQCVRPRGVPAELAVPVTGNGQQVRVERLLQLLDRLGEGAGEVAVLALAEPVPAHDDRRAEVLVTGVEPGDPRALLRGQQLRGQRTAVGIDLLRDEIPVGAVHPPGRWHRVGVGDAHAASNESGACLARGPPRYPPDEPSERTTRWHGTTTGSGLVAQAVPTARTALGLPAAAATAA